MPCDIVDFVSLWPVFRVHPLVAIAAAMLKEPLAIQCWRESGFLQECAVGAFRDDSMAFAKAMHDSLKLVVKACDGCPNREEVEQLSRQGVSRFTGVASTCRCLGIIAELRKTQKMPLPLHGAA